MIVAVHALTGAALARLCKTHARAFVLGALSHLAADLLPHRDLEVAQEALLLGGALGFVGIRRGLDSREFAGAVGAAVPDIENLVARVLQIPDDRLLLPTHGKYHGRKTRGLGGQLALALICTASLLVPAGSCQPTPRHGN